MATTQLARSTAALVFTFASAVASASAAEPPSTAPASGDTTASAASASTAAADIQHLTPKPNFVGPPPQRFEWAAAPGADNYTFGLWTEFDVMLVEMPNIHATAVTWPKDTPPLDPGTYYWSVTAFEGRTGIATSGLAAFVVVK